MQPLYLQELFRKTQQCLDLAELFFGQNDVSGSPVPRESPRGSRGSSTEWCAGGNGTVLCLALSAVLKTHAKQHEPTDSLVVLLQEQGC